MSTVTCTSVGLGEILQHPNRDRNDIGLLPRGRDSDHMRLKLHLLCHEVADDRDHTALAIEHGGSRSPVIQDEAVISIVQLEECRAGEPVLCPVLHESAARETQAVIGIRDARHALVSHERLRPDRKNLCTGKWVPQFEHGYPLGLGAHNTQNASRNRLRALPVPNLDLLPVPSRKLHRLGNMRDGCHRGGRKEPSGPAYTEHAGVRLPLFLGKTPRNACRGLNERRRIDAGGRDTRGRQQQDHNRIKPRPRDQATHTAGTTLLRSCRESDLAAKPVARERASPYLTSSHVIESNSGMPNPWLICQHSRPPRPRS